MGRRSGAFRAGHKCERLLSFAGGAQKAADAKTAEMLEGMPAWVDSPALEAEVRLPEDTPRARRERSRAQRHAGAGAGAGACPTDGKTA